MADYGVNIKFRTIGLSQLDKAKAKAKELETSVSKIRSLDLGKAIRGKVGDQVAEATGQIRRYAKQVNQTGKVIGTTRKQQMAALEAFEMMRDEVAIGSVMFNEMNEAIANQTRLMSQNTSATTKNASAKKKQAMFPGMNQGFLANARGAVMGGGALTSGLVSGAFPLLFGQGLAGGIAGFTGGFAGTKIGGQMGGFAGGLVATAVLQQITAIIEELKEFSKALDPLTLDIPTVAKAIGITGTQTEKYLKLIQQTQGKQAAYNAAVEETTKVIGADGVKALKQFTEGTQDFTNEMTKFFTRLGVEILKLFNKASNAASQGRVVGFKRSNLLNEANNTVFDPTNKTDAEIIDLLAQKERTRNRNKKQQLDNQIVQLMVIRKKEQAAAKEAELRRLEYEAITQNLQDSITFLNNAITLGSAEARIQQEKAMIIKKAQDANLKYDADQIERDLRQREALKKIQSLYDGIASSIETGLVDAIEGAINGTKTLGDVARSVFTEIQRSLIRFGVNAFLGGLPGVGQFFRANGGPVSSGKSYMVGERGPEMFVPNAGGRIVPNSDMGSATNVVVNVDASGSSVEGDEERGKELGQMLSAAIQSELIKQRRPGGLLS